MIKDKIIILMLLLVFLMFINVYNAFLSIKTKNKKYFYVSIALIITILVAVINLYFMSSTIWVKLIY